MCALFCHICFSHQIPPFPPVRCLMLWFQTPGDRFRARSEHTLQHPPARLIIKCFPTTTKNEHLRPCWYAAGGAHMESDPSNISFLARACVCVCPRVCMTRAVSHTFSIQPLSGRALHIFEPISWGCWLQFRKILTTIGSSSTAQRHKWKGDRFTSRRRYGTRNQIRAGRVHEKDTNTRCALKAKPENPDALFSLACSCINISKRAWRRSCLRALTHTTPACFSGHQCWQIRRRRRTQVGKSQISTSRSLHRHKLYARAPPNLLARSFFLSFSLSLSLSLDLFLSPVILLAFSKTHAQSRAYFQVFSLFRLFPFSLLRWFRALHKQQPPRPIVSPSVLYSIALHQFLLSFSRSLARLRSASRSFARSPSLSLSPSRSGRQPSACLVVVSLCWGVFFFGSGIRCTCGPRPPGVRRNAPPRRTAQ